MNLTLTEEAVDEITMRWWEVMYLLVKCLLILGGLIGNLFLIYAAFEKKMCTISNALVANLAVAGILSFTPFPFTVVSQWVFRSWVFGEAMCPILTTIPALCLYVTSITFLVFGLYQFVVMEWPWVQRISLLWSLAIVAAVWVLSLPVPLVMTFTSKVAKLLDMHGEKVKYVCYSDMSHDGQMVYHMFYYGLIYTIMINACLLIAMCDSRKSSGNTAYGCVNKDTEGEDAESMATEDLNIRANHQKRKLFLVMCILFGVCQLPATFLSTIVTFNISNITEHRFITLIWYTFELVGMCSAVCFPVVVILIDDGFKELFKYNLSCLSSKKPSMIDHETANMDKTPTL